MVRRATLLVLLVVLPAAVLLSLQPILVGKSANGLRAGAECPSLQQIVDEAEPGSVVSVPPCIYREQVVLRKPLILVAQPGAEIRGSDVWTEWSRSGSHWVQGTLPVFPSSAGGDLACKAGTSRCQWPEQVFIDGRPLTQVAANPAGGQFAVDAQRQVLLADDPTGHTVEVTTRTHWLIGQAGGITIQGFTMQHAANAAHEGALSFNGQADCTIHNNRLSYAHGWAVHTCTRMAMLENDVAYNGQLGVGGNASGSLIGDNYFRHNNTEAFDPEWEAGGLKLTRTIGAIVEENESLSNDGPGLWCDIDCDGVTFRYNRVHHNRRIGIQYEISRNGTIHGNAVWENGWDHKTWGAGGGIVISNSSDTRVYENIVAWNADGITVLQNDRGAAQWNWVGNVLIRDNVIVSVDDPSDPDKIALGWLHDPSGDTLFAPTANNAGINNRVWFPTAEGAAVRYAWNGPYRRLVDFAATPGGQASGYLTAADKDAVLAAFTIPVAPDPH